MDHKAVRDIEIINLHGPDALSRNATDSNGLSAQRILQGLQAFVHPSTQEPKQKVLPSEIIWDKKGLQIYEIKSQTPKYYPFHLELSILRKHGSEIATKMFGADSCTADGHTSIPRMGTLIELGAGSLKKIIHLLAAVQNLIPRALHAATYYALDLDESEIKRTLTDLHKFHSSFVGLPCEGKIATKGICADYNDGLDWIRAGNMDPVGFERLSMSRHVILLMGSALGNMSRSKAQVFLNKTVATGMSPGDMILVGLDHCQDADRVLNSYCDIDGLSTELFRNGIRNAARQAGVEGLLNAEDFDFYAVYNEDEHCHKDYVRARRHIDFTVSSIDNSSSSLRVVIAEGELIQMAISHKYSLQQTKALFHTAGLRMVQNWMDDTRTYSVNLLQKPENYT